MWAYIFLLFFMSSCISTTLEVRARQFDICSKLCGGQDKLQKSGIDWLSKERTCTCDDGRRLRYEEDNGKD